LWFALYGKAESRCQLPCIDCSQTRQDPAARVTWRKMLGASTKLDVVATPPVTAM
jgi:hypothetical protein